ncbi:hypothetical protein C7B61_16400 [filamentous cyanobacterium CCP1]|nr:hypothetical protein C7B76_14770 [filamentous cyanobacterium CCP2]PSB61116.1 hypothetical protein C7B61_16400 [filamentous cyanobacterium CCP1]
MDLAQNRYHAYTHISTDKTSNTQRSLLLEGVWGTQPSSNGGFWGTPKAQFPQTQVSETQIRRQSLNFV